MKPNQVPRPRPEADQTVRLPIDTKDQTSSIRISFTDQRLTAHGGMVVWSHFLHQKCFRRQLREVLPHCPTSPNAYDPTDVALGYHRRASSNLPDMIFGANNVNNWIPLHSSRIEMTQYYEEQIQTGVRMMRDKISQAMGQIPAEN